ncbi:MAG: single-stranded DNA-binding protein [Sorangiineae bacterium]|nr:single-stranded DNA-binding protein [Polyangiaceae bacterium]MEB2323905.1 single-stranded DNA-binding protein [Sorangiineae bacterium]
MDLVKIGRALARRIDKLEFGPPVSHVYNPLDYAREPYEKYLARFGAGPKEIVLLGMNPGPFGMAQTGVPFGEVSMVRDWMGIEGKVRRPAREHSKRPVLGFDCERSEVSGARLWGWARARCGTAERFFSRVFVVNYCPLVFMEASGRNVTPDKLRSGARDELYAACDEALSRTIRLLEPRFVIGVGLFAEKRAREVLTDYGGEIGSILHPSPANPKANRDWAGVVDAQLAELGLRLGRR